MPSSPLSDLGDFNTEEETQPSLLTRIRRGLRRIFVGVLAAVGVYLGVCVGALILYSVFFPPITGVQLQREVEAFFSAQSHTRTYAPVPLDRIHPDLVLAAMAGEDTRFFEHPGLDWKAIQKAIAEHQRGDQLRGASTLTQQLVKNLFLTTHRSYLRKGLEVPLALAADALLSKRRILELYLNVIEWAPGIYGAEAAAIHYYGTSAAQLSRRQAAALAACIPNPHARTPQTVGRYQQVILRRMQILETLSLPEFLPSRPPQPTPARAPSPSRPSERSPEAAPNDSAPVPPDTARPTDTTSVPSRDSIRHW